MNTYEVECSAYALPRNGFDGVWQLGLFWPARQKQTHRVRVISQKDWAMLGFLDRKKAYEEGIRPEGELAHFEHDALLDNRSLTILGKSRTSFELLKPSASRFEAFEND